MNLEETGGFPLSNEAYDVMAVMLEKSKGLEVYQRYLKDLRKDTALTQIMVEIKHDDERHIERLKAHLARLLSPPRGDGS